MRRDVIHGSMRDVLKKEPADSFDSAVTDPPYALTEDTGQTFPGRYEANPRCSAGGFMGLAWDSALPTIDDWREVYRVLKPGAHLLAFGGTRTYHRLATLIEDAGFEIRDMLGWCYACLSDDSEILTDVGWTRHNEVNDARFALAFDLASGAIRWEPIQRVNVVAFRGDMVRVRGSGVDQLLTPNHRCVVREGEAWTFREAARVAAEGAAVVPSVRLHADAHLSRLRRHVHATARVGRQGEVARVLAEVQRETAGARARGEVRTRYAGGDRAARGDDARSGEPRLEGRRYDLQDARQLRGRALRSLPGSVPPDGTQGRLRHGASPLRGAGDRAVLVAGRGRSPCRPQPDEQHALQPRTLAGQPVAQVGRARQGAVRQALASASVEPYSGIVWCITVPSGAFVARRRGTVFVTGNSGFPKSLDVSKALDKREGIWRGRAGAVLNDNGSLSGPNYERTEKGDPATAAAAAAAGWGTAIKPAHEPIVLARKPLAAALDVVAEVERQLRVAGVTGEIAWR